jgi:phospholipid/cholesterol/gamma-HCH transport system substrate-binding protein
MAKNISTLRIGIFITLGLAILIISIFMIGDKSALFSSTFTVQAYFNDIQGLKSGATVRLSGIDVGTVESVEITGDTTGRVRVGMKIREEVRRFIRTDTQASIETEGLVGNKVVMLTVGTQAADDIKDGGTIQAKEPLGFAAIIEETQGIMEYTKEMTKDLSEIVARVNRGEGSIGKFLTDDELYESATQLTRSADKSLQSITSEIDELTALFNNLGSGVEGVLVNVDNAVKDIDSLIVGIKEGKGLLGALMVDGSALDTSINNVIRNIELTSGDARVAASRMAENMEALKHNWLFKSYFENRGYWDKAEYEDVIDSKMRELNERMKQLDDRIETLKSLEKVSN